MLAFIYELLDYTIKSIELIESRGLNILAIIPVRGKTLDFGDSTLLETTIDSAKKSKYISEIIVSTDSNETAEIARMHDIDVPFIRPAILSEEFIKNFYKFIKIFFCNQLIVSNIKSRVM